MQLCPEKIRLVAVALLGRETDPLFETVIVAAVACFSCILILNALTRMMSFSLRGIWLSLLITGVSVGVLLAAGVAALVYVAPLPQVRQWHLGPWLPLLAGVASIFLVLAPAMMLSHRGRYGQSVTALLLTAACVAVMVALTNSIIGAVDSGDKDFGRTRDRTTTINRFLNE